MCALQQGRDASAVGRKAYLSVSVCGAVVPKNVPANMVPGFYDGKQSSGDPAMETGIA